MQEYLDIKGSFSCQLIIFSNEGNKIAFQRYEKSITYGDLWYTNGRDTLAGYMTDYLNKCIRKINTDNIRVMSAIIQTSAILDGGFYWPIEREANYKEKLNEKWSTETIKIWLSEIRNRIEDQIRSKDKPMRQNSSLGYSSYEKGYNQYLIREQQEINALKDQIKLIEDPVEINVIDVKQPDSDPSIKIIDTHSESSKQPNEDPSLYQNEPEPGAQQALAVRRDSNAAQIEELHEEVAETQEDIAHRPVGNETTFLAITMRETVLRMIMEHANIDTKRECGGVLLGKLFRNGNEGNIDLVITGIVHAEKAIRQTASINFTPTAWADIWKQIDNNPIYSVTADNWKIVGWYHSHPGYGIFFSAHDLSIHTPHFRLRYHVALVVDPKQNSFGFFSWDRNREHIYLYDNQRVKFVSDEELSRKLNLNLANLPKPVIP